ncbi:hypothetical protein F5148DRAFT_1284738 [Russula earlei]|uniref:Uncharacterized protein n=1 Tax=Russula earlei TaxID=71964 RepID=A0ACC0U836_9AGAM|nr:hypothetical protein F5148DRAFT_1284738 [Russula earlei]
MSDMLDVWSLLPVVISQGLKTYKLSKSDLDSCWGNVAAFLASEHHRRICEIELSLIPTSHWGKLVAEMQKPFPELTLLHMSGEGNMEASLPDSFLGGSASLLRHIWLENCPFPGMPKLLLSINHLVTLRLWNIPHSGYISPQALVTAVSLMSGLETLRLEFQSPRSRPDPESRPPTSLTRSVLPLRELFFKGVHEYLEDLLAYIETPVLNKLKITFFMDLNFVVPQLHQLISRAEFGTCDKAFVYTSEHAIRFAIFRETHEFPELSLEIRCRELDYQVSSLAQVCSSSLPLLSTLVQLDIVDPVRPNPQSHWKDDMETTQWLEVLEPFTAVKDLRLSDQVAPHVCQALEELAEERVTEVLPALQSIFLSGLQPVESVPIFIEGFVTARQLTDYPVAVYRWGDRRNYSGTQAGSRSSLYSI